MTRFLQSYQADLPSCEDAGYKHPYDPAYECKPAMTKFTAIRLNIMITKPMTASHADFSPCHPFDKAQM